MSAQPEFELNIADYMNSLGKAGRKASQAVAASTTAQRNDALFAMADAIQAEAENLKTENTKDLEAGKARGLDSAMLGRRE